METIILWIVIIVAGAVWERIKKNREANDESDNTRGGQSPVASPLPDPCELPWALRADTPEGQSPTPKTPAPATATDRPKTKAKTAKPAQTSLPHTYKPIQPTEPDAIMQVETLENDGDCIQAESKMSPQEQRSRQAHYDRWRRAILDTQILERKF